MHIKVYHYAKCGTCRKAIKWLEAKGLSFEALPIREIPPQKAELEAMLNHYGNLKKLFNTSGQDYRAMNLKEKIADMSVEEGFKLLLENGNLLKRPFLISEKGNRVGFKLEEWEQIFR